MTLPPGYRHRTAACPADIDRLAAFNAGIHGDFLDPMTRAMADGYPAMTGADWSMVETDAGELVSTLCRIPWRVRLDGVELPVGELGIVGTHAEHRGRGLLTAQAAWHRQRMAERGDLLSVIQGIPYFYRQYGYSYALPLDGGVRVVARDLPDEPPLAVRLRAAQPADLPALRAWADAGNDKLELSAVRDDPAWAWCLASTCVSELLIVENSEGIGLGYVRLPCVHFGDELAVREASPLGHDAAVATLSALLALASERGKPGVRIDLADGNPLMQLARSRGCHELGRYSWQVMLPDPVALLAALIPAFDCRLAASAFAVWSGELRLGWYRGGAVIRIESGHVTAVEAAKGGEVSLPPEALPALVLGWRTLDELKAQYPDVSVAPQQKWLAETLFPRLKGHLHASL